MNLILIFLCGTLMGAFNFAFFLLGLHIGSQRKEDDSVTVTEDNAKLLSELTNWLNYGGKK